MQGGARTIKSNLWLSALPKNTMTEWKGEGILTPNPSVIGP